MTVTIKSYRREREGEIVNKLEKAMGVAGAIVERQAKINVSKSGGEHPQVQTGLLRSSITHRVEMRGNEITTEVGTNVYYGKYLEFGSSRMPPFPWLFPAVESKRNKIIEAIKSGGGILGAIE